MNVFDHNSQVGKKYNKLIIISYEKRNGGNTYYYCKCDCGNFKWIRCGHVLHSQVKSCGCLVTKGHEQNLLGLKFGWLTVIDEAPRKKKERRWLCRCKCGKTTTVSPRDLREGLIVSCGCFHKKQLGDAHRKHGDSSTRLYHIHQSMKRRCYTKTDMHYADYGGRGISICEEWLSSDSGYENFKKWALSNGYKDNLSIDRIDVNGNYEPGNCRWTTWKVQNNNTRQNHFVEYKGEVKTIAEWAEITGIPYGTLSARIHKHFPLEKVFNTDYKRERKCNGEK